MAENAVGPLRRRRAILKRELTLQVDRTPDEVDFLVHAGDFTINSTLAEIEDFCAWIKKLGFPKDRVVVVPGNHDLMLDETFYRRHWEHYHGTKVGGKGRGSPDRARKMLNEVCTLLVDGYHEHQGVVFYGSPASLWVREQNGMGFQGDSNILRKEYWNVLTERLRKRPCDVLITHGPPRAEENEHFFLDRVFFGIHVGCSALSDSVRALSAVGKAPQFHIFGHIHEGYGAVKGLGNGKASETT